MASQLCCLQSVMAFDSPPPLSFCWFPPSNPVFIKQPHHLSVQEECVGCEGPRTDTAASFCLHFGGDRRGRGSERLTAGLLRFMACLTGLCSLLVLSLACLFFCPKSLFPPHSDAMCQWVFAWNTEIACVLFYLSGIQWEFPLQPTAGSGMSCDSPLKSPLTSSPPYPPSRSLFYLFALSPHFPLILPLSPHRFTFYLPPSSCLSLSVCSSFQGWQLGRRLAWGEESASAKAHKLLTANTKSCCGDRITFG